MIELSYDPRGEYEIKGRRYFRKGRDDHRIHHHIHTYEPDNLEVAKHLDFRNHMRTHSDDAQAYADPKSKLPKIIHMTFSDIWMVSMTSFSR